MRAYLPATLPLLRSWLAAGEVPAGTTGFAVTPGLRAWYASTDDEELEHAASLRAARGSLRLLGDGSEPRRVVIAVEAAVDVHDDLDEGVVVTSGPVRWGAVKAGLVDDPSATAVVTAAVGAVDAADLGDLDADLVVGEADDRDLLWYATQELADL